MVDLSASLSANFTLRELVVSSTVERIPNLKDLQDNPPGEVIENLRRLAKGTLQPLRERLQYPIHVTSGYRCKEVNERVGGSATSQHVRGEAADCQLSPAFLTDPRTEPVRKSILAELQRATGKALRPDVGPNFFLFAAVCLAIEVFDVDQLIHEYGAGYGQPAWVHVSSSKASKRRQILFVGSYTDRKYVQKTVTEGFALFV